MKNGKVRCIPQQTALNLNLNSQQAQLKDEQDDITGCFIDRKDHSIHWIHAKIKDGEVKVSKKAQSFETLCQYRIEYPILCFQGPLEEPSEMVFKLVSVAVVHPP